MIRRLYDLLVAWFETKVLHEITRMRDGPTDRHLARLGPLTPEAEYQADYEAEREEWIRDSIKAFQDAYPRGLRAAVEAVLDLSRERGAGE
jgi:hypothetical protein